MTSERRAFRKLSGWVWYTTWAILGAARRPRGWESVKRELARRLADGGLSPKRCERCEIGRTYLGTYHVDAELDGALILAIIRRAPRAQAAAFREAVRDVTMRLALRDT